MFLEHLDLQETLLGIFEVNILVNVSAKADLAGT